MEPTSSSEIDKVEYDYMARVADLFDTWQSPDCSMDKEWIAGLVKTRSHIADICDHVTKTGMFEDSQDKYQEFKTEIEEEPDLIKRLTTAYNHFLHKVANAPTRMHARGVVILCLPLLLSVLDQYINEHRPETTHSIDLG